VTELLNEHVPLLADDRMPTVLVLDEVESMTVARSAAALDRTAADHPHIITIATSNFTEALDEAFQSRADTIIEVPLPTVEAIHLILARTLRGFAEAYPALLDLADSAGLGGVARRLAGSDGRQVRKFVTEAMTRRLATVMNPGELTLDDLNAAAAEVRRLDVSHTTMDGQHAAA